MGIVDKLLGEGSTRNGGRGSHNEYVELDLEKYEMGETGDADMTVHIAELTGREGIMDVKDLIYDGDLVVADISYFRSNESKTERIMEEFRDVTDEVGGDIVQKGEDQIIIAPRGVSISRDKIAR
ncbi:cell division protein SepF [Halorutilales archaeon Cl-col2-1]